MNNPGEGHVLSKNEIKSKSKSATFGEGVNRGVNIQSVLRSVTQLPTVDHSFKRVDAFILLFFSLLFLKQEKISTRES